MSYDFLHRAWAEIHLDRLKNNLHILEKFTDSEKTQIACVVKANAYGHDDESIVPYLESLGVGFFAVSNIKEAEKLRACGVRGEILILGHTPAEYAPALSENNIIQTAVSAEYAQRLSDNAIANGVCVRIHAAVDTGMGRIGICVNNDSSCNNAAALLLQISRMKGVSLEGAFTHYAAADSLDSDDIAYTARQTELFFNVCDKARSMGVDLRHVHCLNSAGGVYRYDQRSTLFRLGIMLYGLLPDRSLELPNGLAPVMDLKAAVSYVKKLPPDSFVSYGRAYKTCKEITVATIPIGYADGYPRALSGKAHVIINGKKVPVIGRICMDQLMADVSGIDNVSEGTVVTLIGQENGIRITADDLAALSDTIGYEIVCGISKRVPRVIFKDNEINGVVEYY